MRMARIDGSIYKFFEKTAKADVLILDDFGLTHLEKQNQLDFMELIEDRHGKKATIIASQLPMASWFDIIGEDIADAVCLAHTSYKIELKGDSLRKIGNFVILSGINHQIIWGVNMSRIGGQFKQNIHSNGNYDLFR